MRGVIVVEVDAESREVKHELRADPAGEILGCHTQFACLDHDRRAVRVAGAVHLWPRSFWKRTQMSVWRYSTRCPM
jgi:hypothetical protein